MRTYSTIFTATRLVAVALGGPQKLKRTHLQCIPLCPQVKNLRGVSIAPPERARAGPAAAECQTAQTVVYATGHAVARAARWRPRRVFGFYRPGFPGSCTTRTLHVLVPQRVAEGYRAGRA